MYYCFSDCRYPVFVVYYCFSDWRYSVFVMYYCFSDWWYPVVAPVLGMSYDYSGIQSFVLMTGGIQSYVSYDWRYPVFCSYDWRYQVFCFLWLAVSSLLCLMTGGIQSLVYYDWRNPVFCFLWLAVSSLLFIMTGGIQSCVYYDWRYPFLCLSWVAVSSLLPGALRFFQWWFPVYTVSLTKLLINLYIPIFRLAVSRLCHFLLFFRLQYPVFVIYYGFSDWQYPIFWFMTGGIQSFARSSAFLPVMVSTLYC